MWYFLYLRYLLAVKEVLLTLRGGSKSLYNKVLSDWVLFPIWGFKFLPLPPILDAQKVLNGVRKKPLKPMVITTPKAKHNARNVMNLNNVPVQSTKGYPNIIWRCKWHVFHELNSSIINRIDTIFFRGCVMTTKRSDRRSFPPQKNHPKSYSSFPITSPSTVDY